VACLGRSGLVPTDKLLRTGGHLFSRLLQLDRLTYPKFLKQDIPLEFFFKNPNTGLRISSLLEEK